ncbi:phosphate ABC transporter permease subunit PstC [Sphingosinicella sp. LHD-64]|uniref:phosphate ABC transporter permease subunit PstC n=1 Tax=Sphingosinicella sp. LHD-64 TaxID=3072139 RepID=UPI00280D9223|nr:phosphate ABC transporter permease subunit PstC [Sphingosinicella sp. LHD-64]MDQ8757775.1 phosphate ABC transporter permease subunit PstC [Sphingosinicella sp. LHD-64]
MSLAVIAVLVVGLGLVAWISARVRAAAFAAPGQPRPHSLPSQHGWYVALWTVVPALVFLIVWDAVSGGLIYSQVMASPEAQSLPAFGIQRSAILNEAYALATGASTAAFNREAFTLAPVYAEAISFYTWIGFAVALLIAFAAGAWAFSRMSPHFRARTRVERVVMGTLLAASLIAILTTLGIIVSLLFESFRFFSMISPVEFLFGLNWSPQMAIRADQAGSSGAFGAIPLFWGTIFIGAIIAMIVAIPLGLMSAIYLTQYAAPGFRAWMKPILEILAGVPTVVYGYFAALTVAPAIRDLGLTLGIPASTESALAAGLVMGIMIIPFVSSMADDSIAAVPQAMRDGSLAMGATTSETIKKVLVPAALPGVVGGVLLAVSRAIGETMIVVMAAGLAANLTLNPFDSVTTVTTQIVQLLTGDQEFNSPKTLAAFALGLVLFLVTLALNIVALRVVKKYREAYE